MLELEPGCVEVAPTGLLYSNGLLFSGHVGKAKVRIASQSCFETHSFSDIRRFLCRRNTTLQVYDMHVILNVRQGFKLPGHFTVVRICVPILIVLFGLAVALARLNPSSLALDVAQEQRSCLLFDQARRHVPTWHAPRQEKKSFYSSPIVYTPMEECPDPSALNRRRMLAINAISDQILSNGEPQGHAGIIRVRPDEHKDFSILHWTTTCFLASGRITLVYIGEATESTVNRKPIDLTVAQLDPALAIKYVAFGEGFMANVRREWWAYKNQMKQIGPRNYVQKQQQNQKQSAEHKKEDSSQDIGPLDVSSWPGRWTVLRFETVQQSKENTLAHFAIVNTSFDERNTAIGTNDYQRDSVCTRASLFVLRIVEDL
ncbi:legume-like lectin [Pseudozyma hubeiensis SY62]|uniref:Legume-like lectin n=1 Tax=Pseudozyma hubeiensis (strain SY62) TaxID=1305764 RepID=R9PAG7_PSEHS|nr:legume-like lectin [Pseudozyma hubeiensis SY62]GAC98247.1 legume-like lectin [Pseudozyma hubeiensis SY62]